MRKRDGKCPERDKLPAKEEIIFFCTLKPLVKVQRKGTECKPIFQFLTRFPTKASPNRQLMIHSKMVNNCCRHLQLKTDQIFNFSNLYTLVIAAKPLILNQLGKTTKVLFNLQKNGGYLILKLKN